MSICPEQEGPHYQNYLGVPKRGLRSGTWLRAREERLPAEARHRDLLHRAVTPAQGEGQVKWRETETVRDVLVHGIFPSIQN